MKKSTVCSVEGCSGKLKAKGFCRFHYHRFLKSGSPHPSPEYIFKNASLPEKMRLGSEPKPSGCIEWQRGLSVTGYGQLRHSGERLKAHRVAYELAYGPIKNGLYVCHRCDNRKCVNPEHLFLGTMEDNMEDMRKKGRHQRGVRHASAKLNPKKVQTIRSAYRDGRSAGELSNEFGVSYRCVLSVVRRESWRHVPDVIR